MSTADASIDPATTAPAPIAGDPAVDARARVATVRGAIDAILAPHAPAWRAAIESSLLAQAERGRDRYVAYWSTVQPGERIPRSYDRPAPDARQAPPSSEFLTYPRAGHEVAYPLHAEFGDRIHAAKSGTVRVDTPRVRKVAEQIYGEIHAAFTQRACEKILGMAGPRQVERVAGRLGFDRAIEGTITAHLDPRNSVTIDAAVQTNYRYGENAANGVITQYTQYPFRVLSAVVDGQEITGASADDLACRWGGIPLREAERQRRTSAADARKAWSKTRDDLTRRVDAWRDVLSEVTDHARRSLEAAIARDPAHPKHAKMLREVETHHASMIAQNPGFYEANPEHARQRPLIEIYPEPRPLSQPAGVRELQRLGLDAWPDVATAKAQLAQARADLAAHQAAKPVAEERG